LYWPSPSKAWAVPTKMPLFCLKKGAKTPFVDYFLSVVDGGKGMGEERRPLKKVS
jgi:hypothetical protein